MTLEPENPPLISARLGTRPFGAIDFFPQSAVLARLASWHNREHLLNIMPKNTMAARQRRAGPPPPQLLQDAYQEVATHKVVSSLPVEYILPMFRSLPCHVNSMAEPRSSNRFGIVIGFGFTTIGGRPCSAEKWQTILVLGCSQTAAIRKMIGLACMDPCWARAVMEIIVGDL